MSLRDGAARARAAGKLDDAFAALEAANHVAPGDPELLRELVAISRHELARLRGLCALPVTALAHLHGGTHKGDTLLELADVLYDKLDDAPLARVAMRDAADSFAGSRRDTTLRLLATEAASHLAWDLAVEAMSAIVPSSAAPSADPVQLATAFVAIRQERDRCRRR